MMQPNTPFMPVRGIIRSIVPLAPDNYLFEIALEDADGLSHCLPG